MVNDSSLDMNSLFNLDSQTELMQLLVSVRASDLTTAQKNELRDLIFSYINGGKDHSVRIALEQKVATYGIKKVQTANSVVTQTAPPTFGNYRPAPVFSTVPVATKIVSTPVTPVPPAPIAVVPAVSVPVPQVEPVVVAHVVSAPVPPPSPVPVVPPKMSVPVVTSPTVSEVAIPAPIAPEVPVSTESTISTDSNKNLDRIREIKSRVNEKVGNPVNLVDINNEVGREYMSALLDAMKKVGSGSSAISAMKRLEDAFVLVEKTLDEHNKVKNNESVDPIIKPTPTINPVVPVPESIPVESKITIPVAEEIKPFVPAPVKSEPVVDVPVVESVVPNNLPIQKEFIPIAAEFTPNEEKVAYEAPKTEIESDWGPATDTLVKDVSVNQHGSPAGVVSLAQSKIKLRTPEELMPASAIETSSVAGDPLFTREVDDGLHQLLSEWSIFKKSGLFGTGPKGREHPLYKKVFNLPIPLLLAGRFEGATQEIKQSVTDYMNGWRYEQGIIYEQGENFEHYLRRVIRHILDLQNKKRPS